MAICYIMVALQMAAADARVTLNPHWIETHIRREYETFKQKHTAQQPKCAVYVHGKFNNHCLTNMYIYDIVEAMKICNFDTLNMHTYDAYISGIAEEKEELPHLYDKYTSCYAPATVVGNSYYDKKDSLNMCIEYGCQLCWTTKKPKCPSCGKKTTPHNTICVICGLKVVQKMRETQKVWGCSEDYLCRDCTRVECRKIYVIDICIQEYGLIIKNEFFTIKTEPEMNTFIKSLSTPSTYIENKLEIPLSAIHGKKRHAEIHSKLNTIQFIENLLTYDSLGRKYNDIEHAITIDDPPWCRNGTLMFERKTYTNMCFVASVTESLNRQTYDNKKEWLRSVIENTKTGEDIDPGIDSYLRGGPEQNVYSTYNLAWILNHAMKIDSIVKKAGISQHEEHRRHSNLSEGKDACESHVLMFCYLFNVNIVLFRPPTASEPKNFQIISFDNKNTNPVLMLYGKSATGDVQHYQGIYFGMADKIKNITVTLNDTITTTKYSDSIMKNMSIGTFEAVDRILMAYKSLNNYKEKIPAKVSESINTLKTHLDGIDPTAPRYTVISLCVKKLIHTGLSYELGELLSICPLMYIYIYSYDKEYAQKFCDAITSPGYYYFEGIKRIHTARIFGQRINVEDVLAVTIMLHNAAAEHKKHIWSSVHELVQHASFDRGIIKFYNNDKAKQLLNLMFDTSDGTGEAGAAAMDTTARLVELRI